MLDRNIQIGHLIHFLKEEYHQDFLSETSCYNHPNLLEQVIRHEAEHKFCVYHITDLELEQIKEVIK